MVSFTLNQVWCRSVEGSPITSWTCLPVPQLFLAFFPNSISFRVFSAIGKVLGQNDTFVFWDSLQQIGFRLPKDSLECSPNSSLHWSHSLLRLFGQMVVASEKVLLRVPPTILYIYLRVSSWGQSCVNCWHVSPIQIQSAENDPSCRCCWGILWVYFVEGFFKSFPSFKLVCEHQGLFRYLFWISICLKVLWKFHGFFLNELLEMTPMTTKKHLVEATTRMALWVDCGLVRISNRWYSDGKRGIDIQSPKKSGT